MAPNSVQHLFDICQVSGRVGYAQNARVIDISRSRVHAPLAAGPMSGQRRGGACTGPGRASPRSCPYLTSSPARQGAGQRPASGGAQPQRWHRPAHRGQLLGGLVISGHHARLPSGTSCGFLQRCYRAPARTLLPDPGTGCSPLTGVWLSAGDRKHLGCAVEAAGQQSRRLRSHEVIAVNHYSSTAVANRWRVSWYRASPSNPALAQGCSLATGLALGRDSGCALEVYGFLPPIISVGS